MIYWLITIVAIINFIIVTAQAATITIAIFMLMVIQMLRNIINKNITKTIPTLKLSKVWCLAFIWRICNKSR